MLAILAALGILAGGGALAWLLGHDERRATALGAGSAVLASVVGLAYAILTLLRGTPEQLLYPWAMTGGSLRLYVDSFSALFLAATFLLTGACALFGSAYLRAHSGPHRVGAAWAQFNALAISIVLVLVAGDGWVFLLAWEGVALASFLLVMYDSRQAEVRAAGWMYMLAAHLGTAFLLAFFALASAHAGSLSFDRLANAPAMSTTLAGALFLLALAGFGAKAGIVPLHVWLPEAHPAAPSHVSAIMSGIMIKLGIYGLVRAMGWITGPEAWWGTALVVVGGASGVIGVLLALTQHDLKRLLAYHSVENIGIILLGLGVGVLGVAGGAPAVAFLGFAGATLHVFNHAVFKSLLFLGAGAVQHATGTRDIEHLGGLMRRMPHTGLAFLTGSASISGLPPLNGFVSEFLIFVGAFIGASSLPTALAVPMGVAAGALALIGGLACACFVKAVGAAFLGEPRTDSARAAHEVPWPMQAPMIVLAGVCVAVGLAAPLVVNALSGAVAAGFGLAPAEAALSALTMSPALEGVSIVGGTVLAAALVLSALRARLLRGRAVEAAPTWDCGALSTTPRMQYTASSFAEPLTSYFRKWTGMKLQLAPPTGIFPAAAALSTHTPDPAVERGFGPLFVATRRSLARALPFQSGRVQAYVAYIALTALGLLLLEVVIR